MDSAVTLFRPSMSPIKGQMIITTRKTVSMLTGEVLAHDWFLYSGTLALACGASSQQKDLQSTQIAYYDTLMSQAKTQFADATGVFKDLQSVFAPIFAAGPNQHGFSGAELTNLNSTAATGTGQAYNMAAKATNEAIASQGGGNTALPSGVNNKERQSVAEAGAQQLSQEENQIQQSDYDTGRSNFMAAAQGLMGSTSVFGTSNSAGSVANEGGSSAEKTANDIAQESASPFNAVMGAVGGIGGAAAGGFAAHHG